MAAVQVVGCTAWSGKEGKTKPAGELWQLAGALCRHGASLMGGDVSKGSAVLRLSACFTWGRGRVNDGADACRWARRGVYASRKRKVSWACVELGLQSRPACAGPCMFGLKLGSIKQ